MAAIFFLAGLALWAFPLRSCSEASGFQFLLLQFIFFVGFLLFVLCFWGLCGVPGLFQGLQPFHLQASLVCSQEESFIVGEFLEAVCEPHS